MKETNVFGRYHQVCNALLVLGLITVIIAISWFTGLPHVRADTKDNTITMIMNSRYDVTYYPLNVGKTIFWSNKDNVDHKIKITESTTGKLVSESDTIKPYSNFSHTFEKAGVYHFSDPLNSQMGGTVSVSKDITTNTVFNNMKNNVGIQLTREPTKPTLGKDTNFLINFINEKTKKDQEHVDYDFVIYSANGGENKQVYKKALHSADGLEQATYRFLQPGKYVIKVTIYYILFNPVNPDVATFNITT
jgi:plastocyanin